MYAKIAARLAGGKPALDALRPEMAAAAQAVYDAWQQDEDGEDPDYGAGGICDDVADGIVEVLGRHDIEAVSVHDESENHTSVMARLDDGVYSVDIPPGVYETGSFYVYRKRPDVRIDASDVAVWRVFGPEEAEDRWVQVTDW